MQLSEAGRRLIMSFESLRLDAYVCPAGKLTIGYGHTGDVKPGDHITAHQAEAILSVDLDKFERAVSELAPHATQNQFDALVSLAFNIGLEALRHSTLLHDLNCGDPEDAAAEFSRWVHGGGKVLPGLVRRRAAEAELFGRAA